MTTNSYSSNDLIPLSAPLLPVDLVSLKLLGQGSSLLSTPLLLVLLGLMLVGLMLVLVPAVVTVKATAKGQCHESMTILPSFSSSGPNNLLPLNPILSYRETFQGNSSSSKKKDVLDDVYWMIQRKGGGETK